MTNKPNNPRRRDEAKALRMTATNLAFTRPEVTHIANKDEEELEHKRYALNFTKGLPHYYKTGVLQNRKHYQLFVKAIDSGLRRDFRNTPLGHPNAKGDSPPKDCLVCKQPSSSDEQLEKRADGVKRLQKRLKDAGLASNSEQNKKFKKGIGVRGWESQSAGNAFDLEGPDAQAVTMPPAPSLLETPNEMIAEMAEVYAQALLRDIPFQYFDDNVTMPPEIKEDVQSVLDALNALKKSNGIDVQDEDNEENHAYSEGRSQIAHSFDGFDKRIFGFSGDKNKMPVLGRNTKKLTQGNLFRGITAGDFAGPYLSQFLLVGNQGINPFDKNFAYTDGQVTYGALQLDQRVRYAPPKVDYMTTWEEWYAVQCAADVSKMELYANQAKNKQSVAYRFITTPRDLATYVHYDALYEAYLNACLWMLGASVPFDPGIPFQAPDNRDHQQGFAHFGGPHILSLVTEVATRALKCVRFQKFNVHRRLRPEALAARFEKADELKKRKITNLEEARNILHGSKLLDLVKKHNKNNNGSTCEENILLPMAFPEGSPMHPSYGAGHATVAGACVTVLKAFFKGDEPIKKYLRNGEKDKGAIYVPRIKDATTGESELVQYEHDVELTIAGELNKLAANISIGRDWAGVHYYSDYVESLRMGEDIALGILEEQKLTYREQFHMTLTSFDGTPVSI